MRSFFVLLAGETGCSRREERIAEARAELEEALELLRHAGGSLRGSRGVDVGAARRALVLAEERLARARARLAHALSESEEPSD